MAPRAKLVAVCASARVGTRKRPLAAGMLREGFGLVGDAHAGTGRQVSLLAQESVDRFLESDAALQDKGVGPGDFAENLTTSGLVLHKLAVGTRLRIGGCPGAEPCATRRGRALLEITQIGKACHSDCEIKRLTGRCVMPTEGVFARVLVSGEVSPGDEIEVVGPSGNANSNPDSQ